MCHVIGERIEVTPMISLDHTKYLPFFDIYYFILTRSNKQKSIISIILKNTHFILKPTADFT